MNKANTVMTFYKVPTKVSLPHPGDRSALGSLPTRAYRYCDAVTTASGLGWYIYPPTDFSLVLEDGAVYFSFDQTTWVNASQIALPGAAELFDQCAPPDCVGFVPPFVTTVREPGLVQIWTGLLVRTAPGWSTFLRAPANVPRRPFEQYEGVVETDAWFGPLFTNIRLIRANDRVDFSMNVPLVQVLPLPQHLYADTMNSAVDQKPIPLTQLSADGWEAYRQSIVAPNLDPDRQVGQYSIDARRRRKGGCPRALVAATSITSKTYVQSNIVSN